MQRIVFGLLIFPRMTHLDMAGPYEVFRCMDGVNVLLVARNLEQVASEGGMRILPDVDFDTCPKLDVLCVPGGPGVDVLMEDEATLTFLRKQAENARYVTSVCTGALLLGAAGLLRGRKATTHWAAHDLLAQLGAIPTHDRVVRDGNVFTGGGVTAGIDFGLTLAAEIAGEDRARALQLQLEYAPAPPFEGGTPETSPPDVVAAERLAGSARRAAREAIVARIVANRISQPIEPT
jgi:cyclohexyl-isocyanide hydratase